MLSPRPRPKPQVRVPPLRLALAVITGCLALYLYREHLPILRNLAPPAHEALEDTSAAIVLGRRAGLAWQGARDFARDLVASDSSARAEGRPALEYLIQNWQALDARAAGRPAVGDSVSARQATALADQWLRE